MTTSDACTASVVSTLGLSVRMSTPTSSIASTAAGLIWSAGSLPADQINPAAVEAMLEVGVDIRTESPKVLTTDAVQASDVVITMGCGDVCPVFPGKRYEDWALDDPAGQGIESVRPIRDEIRARVERLLDQLGVPAASS